MKISTDSVELSSISGLNLKSVNIIKKQGEAVLVEWNNAGKPERVTIPANEVTDGLCTSFVLEAGIPFGLPWEEILGNISNDADFVKALANNLRTEGVWTAEDVTPQRILAALQNTYGVDVHKILRTMKEFIRQ